MKERTLRDAIQQFRDGIDDKDYANLGAKGKYLTVGYRIKFVREYFGERIRIITDSFDLPNGSHKFKTEIYLDDKIVATGLSKQMKNADKEFEKQSTVSCGRALSFMGLFGDEIATAEEMEDFLKPQKKETKQVTQVKKEVVNKKINTQEFAKEWIEKLKKQAELSPTVNKFEQGIQVLGKEYKEELDQLYSDPIEDVRVANEYNKLKSQIQTRKSNGR